jgi:hypothetical protein
MNIINQPVKIKNKIKMQYFIICNPDLVINNWQIIPRRREIHHI